MTASGLPKGNAGAIQKTKAAAANRRIALPCKADGSLVIKTGQVDLLTTAYVFDIAGPFTGTWQFDNVRFLALIFVDSPGQMQ